MSWEPFIVCAEGEEPPRPRPFRDPEGLGDRLRTAAFAELQAVRAFGWAAERFDDVPEELRQRWAELVADEQRHYDLIVGRMDALGVAIDGRPVSTALWRSLEGCDRGRDFCIYIASAEERGRQAGVALVKALEPSDPTTAAVFREIVEDEVEHIALADIYYGWTP
jgi:uncharacterized ferritin-like protein (DUF455 family)